MSFAFSTTVMLILGSSAVIGFVLNPTKEEPTVSDSAVSHRRCHVSSLQSIRKYLLNALNLQIEPQLPAAGADRVREQWLLARESAPPPTGGSRSATVGQVDVGNSTTPRCCSVSSEILMTDLGWHTWVIHPISVTVVECAICSQEGDSACPLSLEAGYKMPCCQASSLETVPIVYLNDRANIVLSSMQLTRGCSCGAGDVPPTTTE